MKRHFLSLVLGLGFGAVLGNAQGQSRLESKAPGSLEVPRGLRPPPGMCRVWLVNVPPSQQPAPTDCVNAVRNRPPNARILFSDTGRTRSLPATREVQATSRKPAPKDTT